MAWQKKHEFLDLKTGMHVVRLHEPDSGAEHIIQNNVGHHSCLHCGHVKAQNILDIQQHIAGEIEALNKSHGDQREYAAKHKVPVRGK